jgi:hypothetical protein
MSVKKEPRHVVRQSTDAVAGPNPFDAMNLKALKPPETLLQLALQILSRVGGWRSQLLIAVVLTCGACAFVWSQIPDQTKLSILDHLVDGSPGNLGVYPSVEIDATTLTYDLSEWTPVPPRGNADQSCKVTTDENLLCRRVRSDALYLGRQAATSGKVPDFTSSTHPVSYHKSSYERIGGPHMAHFNILLNISNEPPNSQFKAHLRSVRYGAFRDPNSEWAAATVCQPTRALTLEIRFPSTKPGRNLRFSSNAEVDGNNYMSIFPLPFGAVNSTPSGLYEIGDNTLKWAIQFPRIGYCYRVDWDW